ncbi:MAG TPA: tripartite tricarboxylate transporter substrate binding protein [Burkholderiales bacterium]|jgi:tripartite-type tricarboxylate transporter receptor subunit TctC|nr:tripartite tricarboxylate transporter substrate binding protein [Burkholderiales bacterium]
MPLNVAQTVLLAIYLAFVIGEAAAQTYPAKPIRIIVGAGSGGGVDTISRLVGQQFDQSWRQQVVVENKPGAGGAVASDQVAKSPPDGYTLLTMSISYAVIPASHKNLGYDPIRDFTPVAVLVNSPNILVVHPSLPVKSVKDLIALAKAHPGQLTYASSGNGGAANLTLEAFKLATGTDIVHIPYKGTAPGVIDTIAGRISLTACAIVSGLDYARQGKLRALATVGARRAGAAPELPTVAEAGVPGYAVDVWYAMFAPAAVPAPVLAKLNGEIIKVLYTPDMKARLAAIGLEPAAEPLAATNAYIKSEVAKWMKVVTAAKITAE